MKRFAFLFIWINLVFLALPGFGQEKNKPSLKAKSLNKEIIGVWALVSKATDIPLSNNRLKFIIDGHWSLTQADSITKVTTVHHGGTYTLKGDSYSEKVEYANANTARFIESVAKFNIKIDKDIIYLTGIDNPWNEIWKRIK